MTTTDEQLITIKRLMEIYNCDGPGVYVVLAAVAQALQQVRKEVVEECAKVAERGVYTDGVIARAIRKLNGEGVRP